MSPSHLRLDVGGAFSFAEFSHDEACPDIGPICALRDEPPQQHHSRLYLLDLRLQAELGLARGLAVQAVLPLRLVNTTTRYTDLQGRPITLDYENIHHRDETLFGFGDAQLLLHAASALGRLHVGGRFGLSVPLGIVHPDPYVLSAQGLPHEHIQLGTGTFDPLVGLDVSGALGRATLAAYVWAQVPLYQGPQGLQAGAVLAGGVVGSLPVGDFTVRLAAQAAGLTPERWHGLGGAQLSEDEGNGGRLDLFVAPGVTWRFASDWSASLDLRVRAWGFSTGAQVVMPLVAELSVGRLFHLESGEHEDEALPPTADVLDVVVDGEAARLDPVPGRWTVFDFWAPWCEACKVLGRELARREGLAVRRVNIVDLDSPIALQELTPDTALPHVRVYDPEGRLVFEGSGPPDELLQAIEQRYTQRR